MTDVMVQGRVAVPILCLKMMVNWDSTDSQLNFYGKSGDLNLLICGRGRRRLSSGPPILNGLGPRRRDLDVPYAEAVIIRKAPRVISRGFFYFYVLALLPFEKIKLRGGSR